MKNPNGLSNRQIAERPAFYKGQVVYLIHAKRWAICSGLGEKRIIQEFQRHVLYPGEPGCPPIPKDFKMSLEKNKVEVEWRIRCDKMRPLRSNCYAPNKHWFGTFQIQGGRVVKQGHLQLVHKEYQPKRYVCFIINQTVHDWRTHLRQVLWSTTT